MRRRDSSEYEPSLMSVETTRTAPPPYETSSLFNADLPVLPQYLDAALALESPQPSMLASLSPHNEGSRASSSQHIETTPTRPEIERSMTWHQAREFNATTRVVSSHSPVPINREVDKPWDVYRKQLSSLSHGLALWDPSPVKALYDCVSIGDVGFINEGLFYRMFNVLLPWDDPSNDKLGRVEPYEPLGLGPFLNIKESRSFKGDCHTTNVSSEGHRFAADFPE